MTAAHVLRRARKLVASGWVQGHDAVDRYGMPTQVRAKGGRPCKFCMAGAIDASASRDDDAYGFARWFLIKSIDGNSIVAFNDAADRTQGEAVAAFDRAIALASQQP